MSNDQLQVALPTEEAPLKLRLQHILHSENLQDQRTLLSTLAVNVLDCGAALLHIMQQDSDTSSLPARDARNGLHPPSPAPIQVDSRVMTTCISEPHPGSDIHILEPVLSSGYVMPTVKMLRYRLDIGKKHQLTVKELKKVLVEESGVDINNINNVMIHGQYTLIELPDEMPQDIFQHLKTVEISQQKLNIKRLKSRTKKQANNRFRRGKPRVNQRSDDDSA